jgi:hypothetical protein
MGKLDSLALLSPFGRLENLRIEQRGMNPW